MIVTSFNCNRKFFVKLRKSEMHSDHGKQERDERDARYAQVKINCKSDIYTHENPFF